MRIVHDVGRGSNLDLILRGSIGLGNRIADALLAIAKALSTPQDNSAQVQELIDKAAAQLNTDAQKVQEAVNEQKG